MGLYGSPDLSNKYGNKEEYERQQKKKKRWSISIQTVVIIGVYLFLLLGGNVVSLTISYLGMLSMIYFVIYFVKMIYKLIKKESVNSEVIKLFICVGVFLITGVLL